MAVAEASGGPRRTNWLYDARVRAIIYQVITAAVVVGFIGWVAHNTVENLEARGIATGFEFLQHPAGFGVPFTLIEYSEESTYLTAFKVAVLNTLFVSFIGIILALSLRVNDFLTGLFLGVGIKLVDFKLEFGRLYEENGEMRIVVADEISPDSCRLWDIQTNEKMDKDRFRRDLGSVQEAYQEVARRLGILQDAGNGDSKKIEKLH